MKFKKTDPDQKNARFKMENPTPAEFTITMLEAKDKIDLGPGNLVFSESGDIYGTRSPLNDKESGK